MIMSMLVSEVVSLEFVQFFDHMEISESISQHQHQHSDILQTI